MGGTTVLGTIDILFNPATTGPTSRTANSACNDIGFNNKVCTGGTNEHATCTVNSECPGGTCNNQCFCPGAGAAQKPNACERACLGGAFDAQPCDIDDDCPGGFCHAGDCRENPGDTDSAQEGICTVGPFDGRCSVNTFVNCVLNQANPDLQCRPPLCPFCEPTETCNSVQRQCFVNPTYERVGSPGVPDRVSAATFCISATSSASVNGVAGLPGPGAITQPTTTMEVGF
jgi:hypothetical protein